MARGDGHRDADAETSGRSTRAGEGEGESAREETNARRRAANDAATVIDERWRAMCAHARMDADERARAFHALARAIERAEKSFEDARGAEASARRAQDGGTKRADALPSEREFMPAIVEYAVGEKMFTCELREQAGAMRVLRACGLGKRLRGQTNDILGEEATRRDVYANVLSELAFGGRAAERALERRASEGANAEGPARTLDARRLKVYAMGAFASLLVTDEDGVSSEHIKNGVMEGLLKPLVNLICKDGAGVDAWEVDEKDSMDLALAAGDECPSGLQAGDCEHLHRALMQARLMCVGGIGDYVECFAEALQHGVLELSMRLLTGPTESGWHESYGTARRFKLAGHLPGDPQLPEALAVISAFLAHRKFAITFIENGGAKLMLNVPRGPMTYYNLTRCMFGIASITTALERLVAPSIDLSRRYVKMALELLQCDNEYARRHAALFLTFAVQIPIVVVAFDAEAGLKLVLDTLRTTAHIVTHEESMLEMTTPQEIAMAKETGDHVSLLLRQYMRAHFVTHVKAIEEKVSGKSKKNDALKSKTTDTAARRAMFRAMDIGHDATDRLFSMVSRQKRIAAVMQAKTWLVIEAFCAQGGPMVLLDLLTKAPGEKSLRECVLGSLSVLKLVTLHPTGRVATAKAHFGEYFSSGYILMDIIESAAEAVDTEAVVEALKVICNLVIAPLALSASEHKSHKEKASVPIGGPLQRTHSAGGNLTVFDYARLEETYVNGRQNIAQAYGVKVLLKLLFKTSKVLPQPSMNISRALCCRVLLGLTRDQSIANTLQTLQIARMLSELVRETGLGRSSALEEEVIVDSKRESGTGSAATVQAAAAEFHRCAVELIAATAGFANVKATTPAVASDAAAPPLAKLERHLIAASTKVRYPHEELLLIMHEHLVSAGLTKTAASLVNEARLARPETGTNNARSCDSPAPRLKLNFKNKQAPSKLRRRAPRSRMTGAARGMLGKVDEPFTLGLDQGPSETLLRELSGAARTVIKQPLTPTLSKRGVKRTHLTEETRVHLAEDLRKSLTTPTLQSTEACCDHQTPSPAVKERFHKEFPTPGVLVAEGPRGETGCGVRSRLDSILTQYLRAQHRQCSAPITACAPFSLLTPHQCPQPKRSLEAPRNLSSRLRQREWTRASGLEMGMRRADRHFVNSRFRPLRTLRTDVDSLFSAVSFVHGIVDQVVVGTNEGEIQVFDCISGEILEISSDAMHGGSIRKIVATGSKCPKPMFAVTSVRGISLWSLPNSDEVPEMIWDKDGRAGRRGYGIAVDSTGSTFAVGAFDKDLDIMDTETKTAIRSLSWKTVGPPLISKNNDELSFSPSDNLLLWDETLWDVRIRDGPPIQRFDRFSEASGACFHPGGNEIIIGREVWDIRSSRLLRTVPALNRAALKFNHSGTVGLAHILHPRNEELLWGLRKCHHPYKHSFCTIDAMDYSDICTVDVTYGMIDACWDVSSDTLCATVEYDILDTHESVVRLHEVGRLRLREDESDMEEDPHDNGMGMMDRDLASDDDEWEDAEWGPYEGEVDADGRRTINDARVARQIASLREIAGIGGGDDWMAHEDRSEESSEYDSDFIDSDDEDSEDDDDDNPDPYAGLVRVLNRVNTGGGAQFEFVGLRPGSLLERRRLAASERESERGVGRDISNIQDDGDDDNADEDEEDGEYDSDASWETDDGADEHMQDEDDE